MKKYRKGGKILFVIILLLMSTYNIMAIIVKPVLHHSIFNHQNLLVMAHRGGRGLRPENTLDAFKHAIALGVDVLDFDIHSLKDGKFVVIHDDRLERTTNGAGNVRDFNLIELQKLDAGYNWTADNGLNYPFRSQGITIPALVEVFAEFPDTRMNIEIKQSQPETSAMLCRLIHEYNMEERVVIASFSSDIIRDFRRVCPDVATAAATGEAWPFFVLDLLRLGKIYHPAAETMQVPGYRKGKKLLSNRFIKTAHRHNMEVYAWTINDIKEMRAMIQLGVNGIITDHPDKLLAVLGR